MGARDELTTGHVQNVRVLAINADIFLFCFFTAVRTLHRCIVTSSDLCLVAGSRNCRRDYSPDFTSFGLCECCQMSVPIILSDSGKQVDDRLQTPLRII